jgi:hypothetical protein
MQSREGGWRGGGGGEGGKEATGMSKEGWWGGRGTGMGRVPSVDQWERGEGIRGEEKCKSSSTGISKCLLIVSG